MDGPTEQELIGRAKGGDKLAYEELLSPNLKPAGRLARVTLGEPGEAEDAVQEAAIKAWRQLDNLRDGSRFRILSRLGHIPVGAAHRNRKAVLLVAGAHVRVVTTDGVLIRELTLDPSRSYQPLGGRWPVYDVLQQASTMS